ncbi:YgaP family membrane protein [Aquimarina aquimarini]|uniref:YgaP family membrane protein n=1 Tax=Aquimarina aquimarini TaxID=1191734 RepID=UPI001F2E3B1D|nr:DUF2892 domain-containing protein [Aquimarina aquimarini]
MQKNVEKIDGAVSIIIGIVLAYLFYNNYISYALGIVLLSISGILILTGFMGWCPTI